MNDNDLITLVREQRDKVPMTMPVEEIISRGRVVRARRRLPAAAGVLALAAALAVSTLTQAQHSLQPAGHHPAARQKGTYLAGYTVTQNPNGTITVIIRQMDHAAGLQATLRADGVPASVTLRGKPNPACRAYPADPALLYRIIHDYQGNLNSRQGANTQLVPALVIRPSAIPPGAGVRIAATSFKLLPHKIGVVLAYDDGLVHASPQCTGS